MLFKNDIYDNDVKIISNLDFIKYSNLQNKSIMISGASGMIGTFLIDVIMELNKRINLNCTILALGRNEQIAKERFEKYWDNKLFKFVTYDINEPILIEDVDYVDYVIHLASNTHPKAYAIEPIQTITTNVIGTQNMLNFSLKHNAKRFLFASTCEIYGENKGDVEKFDEDYLGYINSNTLRAGYPESKRCGEALCQAYIKQENMDIVIARLSRIYGPTLLKNDSKALSQFIKNGINKENIVLKSEGNQYYSYLYVADAVSALLKIMLEGKCGEAYNVADEKSDIRLKDLAKMIADKVGTVVVFELPDEVEKAGFSKATKARLDSKKINDLGWHSKYSIEQGINNTLEILK